MNSSIQPSLTIDGRIINCDSKPYIIAEISGNHNGDVNRAINLVEEAKKAGADAVKLQTYTADTITFDSDRPEFYLSKGPWKGRTLHNLYTEAHMPWDWQPVLFKKAKEIGISIFSSPFDATAVDFLQTLSAPAYKIASPELVDIGLIKKVAETGLPMIISTGMSTIGEISEAVNAAKQNGCTQLALLHCTSAYPAPVEEMRLTNIAELAEKFNVVVGLSDHTLGIHVAIAATVLGAKIIEKHFTLSRSDGGVDSEFSIEPEELRQLVEATRAISNSLSGSAKFGPTKSEQTSLASRRSLFAVCDIKNGEVFTLENIRSIRPANGLEPKHLDKIIGQTAARLIQAGEPLDWDMIE